MFTTLIDQDQPDVRAQAPDARERFLRLLTTAITTRTLNKLVLGQYVGDEAGLERVLVRPVSLRGQPHLQLVWRHATKDITKNHPDAEAAVVLAALIGPSFRNAHLMTATQEVQLSVKEKGGRDKSLLRVGKVKASDTPTDTDTPAGHNREKQRMLQLANPYWQDLGVATAQGELVPAMARKWKQINKFVEVFASALAASPLAQQTDISAVDFGCGKAYLTFALHEYLRAQGKTPRVTGVELRAELTELCSRAVQHHGLQGLRFDAGDVRSYTPAQVDVMIALHACDTATDHAIHLGLRAGASIIMCSPCCHKELRPQMQTPALLRPLLQHGVHLGQEAEMVTDSLRALLLDAAGYDTQIFEFVTLEHTNKNKMILAVKRPTSPELQEAQDAHARQVRQQIADIKAFYGIREHCLEGLMQI